MVSPRHLARRLYTTAPNVLVRKVRRRLFGSQEDRIAEVFDTLIKRPQAPYDFLSRYEAILARAIGWTPIEFEGRTVLEFGCGPHLGFGPLAVFQGARFVAIDPALDPGALDSRVMRERYFRPLYKDLSAIFGEKGSFDDFLETLRANVTMVRGTLLDAETDTEADIILSNSALEHIHPLGQSLQRLRVLAAEGARFLHLVDFGNHRKSADPFEGIYDQTPDDYAAKYGPHLNLVRPNEMLALVRAAGFDVEIVPYYRADETARPPLDPHWQAKMASEDLFLKAALIAGAAGRKPVPEGG